MAVDLLQDVPRDPCVGHPGRAGMAEAVPGQIGKPQRGNEGIPVRRIPDGCGCEHPASWPAKERRVGFAAFGQPAQGLLEWLQDRHGTAFATLGLLGHQAARAWVDLAFDGDDPVLPADVADSESGDL